MIRTSPLGSNAFAFEFRESFSCRMIKGAVEIEIEVKVKIEVVVEIEADIEAELEVEMAQMLKIFPLLNIFIN